MMTLLLNRILKPPMMNWALKGLGFACIMLLSFAAYAQPMSGTYTVCAGGTCNYATVAAAAAALNTNGVSGPVVIDIKAGTYTGQVTLNNITGTSATNTITFKGAGKNSTALTNSGASSKVFYLNYSRFTTIQDMTIRNTQSGGSGQKGLHMIYVQNVIIKNCKIQVDVFNSGSTTMAVHHEYSTGITYQDNEMRGGYYCLYAYDYNYGSAGLHKFLNNRITQFYQYGLYDYSYYTQGKNVYEYNYIDSSTLTSGGYGLYSLYVNGAIVRYNRTGVESGVSIGLYVAPNYNSSATWSYVENNFTGTSTVTGGNYGAYFYCNATANVRIAHNTIHCKGTPSYGVYFYSYNSNNIQFVNNSITRVNPGTTAYMPHSGTPPTMYGNNWYNQNSNVNAYYMGATYADFNSFVTATKEKNASSVPMPFKSATDYHLDQFSAAPYGLYAGVDKDYDGNDRCKLFPTTGADESSYGKTSNKAKFFVPSVVYSNSPVVFYNFAKAEEPKVHRWYIDGVFVEDSLHYATSIASGTHVISLVTEGCAGKDSVWQSFSVTVPPVVSNSDFIADRNTFPQGEMVRLSDLSDYGPSAWQWEITPEQTYVNNVLTNRYKYMYGTSATSQNPIVQFNSSGKYKVCMTATNAKGTGTKTCKVDYIEVSPRINMGDVDATFATEGELFDDGGPNAPMSKNNRTAILINACADDIYFTFSQFDIMSGYDYLVLYDGEEEDPSKALFPCTNNNPAFYSPIPKSGYTGGSTYTGNAQYKCMPTLGDTFVATSGKLLVVQYKTYTFGNTYGQGYAMKWWSTPRTFSPPVASFDGETTICQNGFMAFKNTSTGEDNRYRWDLDNDLSTFESEESEEAQWLFTVPGKRTVTLIAENCGGIDTFTQTIDVFVPNKPNIAFTASNSSPTPDDVVFITHQITECVDDYEWTFARASGKPGTVTFMNNTSKFSDNPQVMFSDTGCWNATLKATNEGGTSTLKKTCFVNVKESYCIPSVATMSKDVGISEVAIISSADSSDLMRNPSPQAVKDYTNYANNPNLSTGLEIGVTYLVEVKRTTNVNSVTRNIWIDWNLDGDFNDPQEEVDVETNSASQNWIASFTVPIIAKTGASIMRVAINTGQFSNAICGQNRFGEYEDYRVELSDDRTPPVITLFGADGITAVESGDTIVIEQGRKFTEWGFKAIDNLDGDVTSNVTSDTSALPNGPVGTLNTFVVRDYMISYYVQDATTNKSAPTNRIIRVIEDTTAPSLKVGGTDTIRHDVDAASFQMPQVISVNDIVDGIQVSMATEIYNNGVKVPSVDPTVVDTYTVVFKATDVAGNMTEITRVIIVEDITKPTLTLNGVNPVKHPVGDEYNDAGVTPNDNYWTDPRLSEGLTMVNNVVEDKIGTYTVEYTLIDPSGNGPVTAVRTVNVVDEIAPDATVEAGDTIVAEVMTEFEYPDVTYDDNYFDNNELNTEWLGSLIGTMTDGVLTQLGTFTLQFVVTDPSNNTTTISRVVRVGDFTVPDIKLDSDHSIDVCRWTTYNDAGYTMDDNYYDNANIVVTEEGSFFTKGQTDVPGLYTFRYRAEDGSGNVGYSEYRSILVKSETEYPCYMNSIEDAASLEKLVNVYPNPSSGNFTVKVGLESQRQLRISVLNLLGEEIMIVKDGQVLSDVYNVDLSTQASGVYMLKVQGADFSFTKRLVIQK